MLIIFDNRLFHKPESNLVTGHKILAIFLNEYQQVYMLVNISPDLYTTSKIILRKHIFGVFFLFLLSFVQIFSFNSEKVLCICLQNIRGEEMHFLFHQLEAVHQ